ncbi:MAG: hypothetical protein U1E76_00820 [Planctomycetota bacterium]
MKHIVFAATLFLSGPGCASQFPYTESSSTHIISTETAYYTTSPAQGRPADGTLKLGQEVTLLAAEGSYSRIRANGRDGKPMEVYVASDALLPLSRH